MCIRDRCVEFTEHSPVQQAFRTLLFSRIVPCVRDIGLWGPKVQRAYTDLGVIDAAKTDLEALMRDDEEIAERVDEEKYAAELAVRQAEVDAAMADGACLLYTSSAHIVVEAEILADGRSGVMLDRLQECLRGHFDVEHSTFQLELAGHVDHEDPMHQ